VNPIFFFQDFTNVHNEVWSTNVSSGRNIDELFIFGSKRFFFGEKSLFDHARKDLGLTVFCGIGIAEGGISRWSLGKADKEGSFGERKIAGRFAEIALAGGFDAIAGAPIWYVVEIHFEDFIFCVENFGSQREEGFADFPGEGSFG